MEVQKYKEVILGIDQDAEYWQKDTLDDSDWTNSDIEELKDEEDSSSDSDNSENEGETDEESCSDSDANSDGQDEEKQNEQDTSSSTPPSSADNLNMTAAAKANPNLPYLLRRNRRQLKKIVRSMAHKIIFKMVNQYQPKNKLKR